MKGRWKDGFTGSTGMRGRSVLSDAQKKAIGERSRQAQSGRKWTDERKAKHAESQRSRREHEAKTWTVAEKRDFSNKMKKTRE